MQQAQRELIQEHLRPDGAPVTDRYVVSDKGDCHRMTLMDEAVEGEGFDADNDEVEQTYVPEEGVVLVDLNP